MKPYQQIPILECGELLAPIPTELFAVVTPHPYEALNAPYGTKSPYYLRQGVLNNLSLAQAHLQQQYPGWSIQIFDAYRPVAVQQFMVDYTFKAVVQAQGLDLETLTTAEHQLILEQVYQFWAAPSFDLATPPPHSTGAAIDVALIDGQGQTIDMGSAIDEISPRSYPNHFATSLEPQEQIYDQNRQILRDVMIAAGFQQHPHEWWHFSLGDQMWAWLNNQQNPGNLVVARYGRVD